MKKTLQGACGILDRFRKPTNYIVGNVANGIVVTSSLDFQTGERSEFVLHAISSISIDLRCESHSAWLNSRVPPISVCSIDPRMPY
jgi:hypothetical protein